MSNIIYSDVQVKIVGETETTVKIDANGIVRWIPKSLVEYNEAFAIGYQGPMRIEKWKADMEGLPKQ